MNNILPSGVSRFNQNSVSSYINLEDDESSIIGNTAGKKLVQNSSSGNTIIGYYAGQEANEIKDCIYLGKNAGRYITNGNNILILGEDKYIINNISLYKYIISVGYINYTLDNSISCGFNIINNGNYNYCIGNNINITGSSNIALGNNYNINGTNSIVISNNELSKNIYKSILIGNNNTSNLNNTIILGNDIKESIDINNENYIHYITSNKLFIGNSIDNSNINFTLNIGNIINKYDNYSNNEFLFLGLKNKYNNSNLPVLIGYNNNEITSNFDLELDINNSNIYKSLYIKGGISTDNITFINTNNTYTSNIDSNDYNKNKRNIKFIYNNLSDILNLNSELSSELDTELSSNLNDIIYNLPYLNNTINNKILSCDNDGNLEWKNLYNFSNHYINSNINTYMDNILLSSNISTYDIGNVLYNYDNKIDNNILLLGINNNYDKKLPVAIGYRDNDIINNFNNGINLNTDNIEKSLYVNGGISTDNLTFTNNNIKINLSVSLLNSNNINYKLPELPLTYDNISLSVDNEGQLYWKNDLIEKSGDIIRLGSTLNEESYIRIDKNSTININPKTNLSIANKFVVSNTAEYAITENTAQSWIENSGIITKTGTYSPITGLLYDTWCCTDKIIITSDERMKTNITDLNNLECLNIINKLKPKKYRYKEIDKEMKRRTENVIGFIAQDVNNILPDAVSKTEEFKFIPNIQRPCILNNNILSIQNTSNITIKNNSNIHIFNYDYVGKIDDIIEIHSSNKKYEIKINNIITSNTFNIDFISDKNDFINSNLFAYGTKVNDFLAIDKSTIYTVGIGAIQELYKENIKIKESHSNLEIYCNSLEKRLSILENIINNTV